MPIVIWDSGSRGWPQPMLENRIERRGKWFRWHLPLFANIVHFLCVIWIGHDGNTATLRRVWNPISQVKLTIRRSAHICGISYFWSFYLFIYFACFINSLQPNSQVSSICDKDHLCVEVKWCAVSKNRVLGHTWGAQIWRGAGMSLWVTFLSDTQEYKAKEPNSYWNPSLQNSQSSAETK